MKSEISSKYGYKLDVNDLYIKNYSYSRASGGLSITVNLNLPSGTTSYIYYGWVESSFTQDESPSCFVYDVNGKVVHSFKSYVSSKDQNVTITNFTDGYGSGIVFDSYKMYNYLAGGHPLQVRMARSNIVSVYYSLLFLKV